MVEAQVRYANISTMAEPGREKLGTTEVTQKETGGTLVGTSA